MIKARIEQGDESWSTERVGDYDQGTYSPGRNLDVCISSVRVCGFVGIQKQRTLGPCALSLSVQLS